MRYGWAMVTLVAWALWFGGMGALVLFVGYLFTTDRPTAVVAAPKMFEVFEKYQVIVGAVALVSAALWRMVSPGRTAVTFVFVMLLLATVGVMVSAVGIRRPMERLRAQGLSQGEEFRRLHKLSERLFSVQMGALLVAGIILPVALAPEAPPASLRRRRETEAAGPTAPPGGPADPVA